MPPQAGDMNEFEQHFRAAKAAGLGVTLHIAEVLAKSILTHTIAADVY